MGLGGQRIGIDGKQLAQGGQTIGLAGNQLAQGGQTMGLAGNQLAQGAQTYGAGAGTAAAAGGLYGQAQGSQEAYGMDTAQMAQLYGGLQAQQAQNLLGNMQSSGQLFQKRPFGLGGTNAAQSELGRLERTILSNKRITPPNGIANQAQMNQQQRQLQSPAIRWHDVRRCRRSGTAASAAAAAAAITLGGPRMLTGDAAGNSSGSGS